MGFVKPLSVEAKARIQERMRDILSSEDKCIAWLQRLGYLDDEGKVTERYGGSMPPEPADSKADGEPDWNHPTIQGLIGADARNRITIDLIWKVIKNPECELTPGDMEYWDAIHDALKAALTHPPQQAKPLTRVQIEFMLAASRRNWMTTIDAYYAGVRDTERAHGIGDQA